VCVCVCACVRVCVCARACDTSRAHSRRTREVWVGWHRRGTHTHARILPCVLLARRARAHVCAPPPSQLRARRRPPRTMNILRTLHVRPCTAGFQWLAAFSSSAPNTIGSTACRATARGVWCV
jgi:hypothetical protein